MSYSGIISNEVSKKEVKRFQCFFLIFLIGLILIVILFSTSCSLSKILFALGTYIGFASLINKEFFDIRKNIRQGYEPAHSPHNLNDRGIKSWLYIEKIMSYVWIVGYILVSISAYLQF